jgi:GT2 family glycosyltransferase
MPNFFGMVNTNKSNSYTNYALDSFFKKTTFDSASGDKFYLIDNDHSLLDIPSNAREKVIIVKNDRPKSFAENVNQVLNLALSSEADLIFLNNDIIFTDGWLSPLLERENSITLPLCNQYECYKNNDFEIKGAMDLQDYIGNEKHFDALINWRKSLPRDDKYIALNFIPFYCFRLPLSVALQVGYFDEGFGKGGAEDIDFRIRANLKGFSVELVVDSYVLHFMGKSTWRGGETPEETTIRNQIYFEKFVAKWGIDLANIFLDPSKSQSVIEKFSLQDQWNKKDYKSIIERCMNK